MGAKWTGAEDAILIENIAKHGPSWEGWAELLPGRSAGAIKSRKATLGATGVKAKPEDDGPAEWTDEQRRLLVESATTITQLCDHSLYECALELARIIKRYRRQKKGGRG